jgi:hypothetical protein
LLDFIQHGIDQTQHRQYFEQAGDHKPHHIQSGLKLAALSRLNPPRNIKVMPSTR